MLWQAFLIFIKLVLSFLKNRRFLADTKYGNREQLESEIKELKKHNRPLINTEWMNRPNGSTIANNLEVFYNEKVGCMLWGLVNGKTQTDLPWGHRPGDPEPKVWQHDLFHGDFTPYDKEEIATLKKYTGNANAIR